MPRDGTATVSWILLHQLALRKIHTVTGQSDLANSSAEGRAFGVALGVSS